MRRTDGRARTLMFAGLFSGAVSNQKALAEKSEVPVALVDGADDPFVNLDYVSSLAYASLWDKHHYLLRDGGHAAFLGAPAMFDAILARFVADMAKRAQSVGRKAQQAAPVRRCRLNAAASENRGAPPFWGGARGGFASRLAMAGSSAAGPRVLSV